MITAAENRSWPGDIRLSDAPRAGLAIPSVIRPTKIATIEAAQASRIGNIGAAERRLCVLRSWKYSLDDNAARRRGSHQRVAGDQLLIERGAELGRALLGLVVDEVQAE